ncbi:MAG: NAD(P)-dependent oxidoreductase [Acidimicrobiales bacterium]
MTTIMWFDRPVTDLAPDELGSLLGDRIRAGGPDLDQLAIASAAIAGGSRWDGPMFDRAPGLQVVARVGIGVDSVDLDEATRRGVAVTNTPDGPTVSTAEHAVALMFSVTKTIGVHQQRRRDATGGYAASSTAVELDGLTLGLVGYGRIARRVARIARAVGMTVLATDPALDAGSLAADDELVELVDLDRLTARADVISLHCPLLPTTERLFDTDRFDRCRRGVVLINAARGGVVDHDALLAALDDGRVAGAGLDVTDPEPLPADHPLLHRDDVVVTGHVASSTVVGRRRMLTMAIGQARMVLEGARPTWLVNPDVWDRRR